MGMSIAPLSALATRLATALATALAMAFAFFFLALVLALVTANFMAFGTGQEAADFMALFVVAMTVLAMGPALRGLSQNGLRMCCCLCWFSLAWSWSWSCLVLS